MLWNSCAQNPFLVSESCLTTNMFKDKHVVTSGKIHLHDAAVKMFNVKAHDWDKSGRAKNQEAKEKVMYIFQNLAVSIADACKSIVHRHDEKFYSMATQKFDELALNPQFNKRVDINVRHYKCNPTGETVINHCNTGFEVAHYFLRVFRHNEKLKNIVDKYHQAWLLRSDHEITSDEKISLKLSLLPRERSACHAPREPSFSLSKRARN